MCVLIWYCRDATAVLIQFRKYASNRTFWQRNCIGSEHFWLCTLPEVYSIYGATVRKLPLINFGLIQFTVRLFCDHNFQEKELSHKCSTLTFERLFVAAAATVYQFWTTEGHCISVFDPKNFSCLNPLQHMI